MVFTILNFLSLNYLRYHNVHVKRSSYFAHRNERHRRYDRTTLEARTWFQTTRKHPKVSCPLVQEFCVILHVVKTDAYFIWVPVRKVEQN